MSFVYYKNVNFVRLVNEALATRSRNRFCRKTEVPRFSRHQYSFDDVRLTDDVISFTNGRIPLSIYSTHSQTIFGAAVGLFPPVLICAIGWPSMPVENLYKMDE